MSETSQGDGWWLASDGKWYPPLPPFPPPPTLSPDPVVEPEPPAAVEAEVPPSERSTDTRACPFCAEEILTAAKKCKHCGEMLEDVGHDGVASTGECIWRFQDSFWECTRHGLPSCESCSETLRRPPQKLWGISEGDCYPSRKHPEGKWAKPGENTVCPHCGEKGLVTMKKTKVRRGIHGGKATAAVVMSTASWF